MNHPIYIYSIIVISYQPQYYLTLIFDIQSSITLFAQRDSWFPTVFETAVATKISKRNDVSVAHVRLDATVFIEWNIKRLPRGPP